MIIMQRRCRNRDCQVLLPPPPFIHRSSLYCSDECRQQGQYTLNDAFVVDDPVAAINQFGQRRNAFYARLGTRLTTDWRFFPAESIPLPFSELPPLPIVGRYRVQLFDIGQVLIRDSEMRIFIPAGFIKKFCRFVDGGRSSTKLSR